MANTTSVSRARALTLIGAAAALPQAARAQSAPLRTVRICGFPADSYAEPYYAAGQGFPAANGIDLSIITLPTSGSVAQAVVADAIDIGMFDALQIANAHLAGVPLAFFGGAGLYSSSAPTTMLVVANGSPLQKAKQFEGRTIGVLTLGALSSLTLQAWLQRNGADPAKVRLVEVPYSVMTPALERGTIDAAHLAEPFLSQNRDRVRPLCAPQDEVANSFYICGFFAKRDWLQQNHDVARSLLKAMYDTARWANTHHDETAAILVNNSKLDIDQVKKMTRVSYATSLDPSRLQPVLDIGFQYGLLKRKVKASEIIVTI